MGNVPNNFLTQTEATPTYDAIDAALGVGYARYYGFKDASGATILTPSVIDSAAQYSTGTSTATGANVISVNFDLEYKFPQVIQGDLIVTSTYGTKAKGGGSAGASDPYYLKSVVEVYHINSSGTITSLNKHSGAAYHSGTYTDFAHHWRDSLILTIPKTNFSIGDKLRINVNAYGYDVFNSDTFTADLFHDPSDRESTPDGDADFASHDTNLIVDVPYRIDL